MKKRIIIISLVVISLLVVLFGPYFVTRIRTKMFLSENKDSNVSEVLEEILKHSYDDYAVLDYSDTNVTLYFYRISDKPGTSYYLADFIKLEKENNEWKYVWWDKSWSAAGDGNSKYVYSYWWHIFYSYSSRITYE